MSLPMKEQDALLNKGFSRRQLGRIASLLSAGAALPFYNEFAMAQDAERRMMRGAGGAGRMNDPDLVRISSNENPMGPCKEALESMAKIAPLAWRYSPIGDDQDFVKTVAGMEDVPPDHIAGFAGSSDPFTGANAHSHRPGIAGRWPIRATARARLPSSDRNCIRCRCARISATTLKR